MQKIYYCDHAATSFPNAPGVGDAMKRYIDSVGMNINRSTYAASTHAAEVALETRERLCTLFHFPDLTHVVFTPGQTWSLNFAIHGALENGGHVVVSGMEHNAVMRPLTQLTKRGVTFTRAWVSPDGTLDLAAFEKSFRPDTRLCVVTHASNVTGGMLPLEAISQICKAHCVPLVLDAAQTAGHVPIDFPGLKLSALAVPGHKGLLGPSGIGVLLMTPEFAASLEPLVTGGTGSASDSEEQPPFMPDRFESGTQNLPGIYGLHAALGFLLETGVDTFHQQELTMTAQFLDGVANIPGVHVHGGAPYGRVGVVSCTFDGLDNAEAAYRLETEHSVLTRCGLHCAPNAHRTLGTFPSGTVRFSFGYGNTESEIAVVLDSIKKILR